MQSNKNNKERTGIPLHPMSTTRNYHDKETIDRDLGPFIILPTWKPSMRVFQKTLTGFQLTQAFTRKFPSAFISYPKQ
jgi:hypothetical protein